MLLTNHEIVAVAEGVKIDAAGFIAAGRLPEERRESLLNEVQAGFDMYRNTIAERTFGRPVAELSEEELAQLDDIIPFQFDKEEENEEAEAEAEVAQVAATTEPAEVETPAAE